MKRAIQITIGFLLVLTVSSCSFKEVIEFRKRLTNTHVESADFICKEKRVHFIDMVHIGQEQFYVNVRNEILEFKHKGYVLFYEWIDYNQTDEITLRKTKKLVGLVPSQKGYSQILSNIKLEGVTVQDNQLFLGLVNGRDFNVDITPEEVISAYEKQFGEIQLSREELESPLDELYEPSQGSENLKSIILDYRNRYLASKIQESQYDKIVVIYGADHQIGLLEELQSLDQSWRRADP